MWDRISREEEDWDEPSLTWGQEGVGRLRGVGEKTRAGGPEEEFGMELSHTRWKWDGASQPGRKEGKP